MLEVHTHVEAVMGGHTVQVRFMWIQPVPVVWLVGVDVVCTLAGVDDTRYLGRVPSISVELVAWSGRYPRLDLPRGIYGTVLEIADG